MIRVGGGTYLERCREPSWNQIVGSGFRGAGVIAGLGSKVQLDTFIGKDDRGHLETIADLAGIGLSAEDIPETIRFEYLHPLSKPMIEPDLVVRDLFVNQRTIKIDGEYVLRYGVMEGSVRVRADMAVYDPQSPSNPRPFAENGSSAKRLAIVANRAEMKKLTGNPAPEEACADYLRAVGAEVLVMKCGADGCRVITSTGSTAVPAFRTKEVWPIGSGDVFSGAFAQAWMEQGLDPVEAAHRASRATAHYAETRSYPTVDEIAKETRPRLKLLAADKRKRVYLAGPFFTLSERWLIEEFRNALLNAGVEVFSPLHDVGRGPAEAIYSQDIAGLEKAGVVLACFDGLDSGTLYEVGYAHKLRLPVIGFVSADYSREAMKMPEGGDCRLIHDFATALYWTVWAATCE